MNFRKGIKSQHVDFRKEIKLWRLDFRKEIKSQHAYFRNEIKLCHMDFRKEIKSRQILTNCAMHILTNHSMLLLGRILNHAMHI
jgi:hypothetical protein